MPTDDDGCFFQGVPHFFRNCCADAKLGLEGGYSNAGYQLAIHLGELIEPDGTDGPEVKLNELTTLLVARNDKAALAFFRREFPACMRLVPRFRGRQFLKGVYVAHEQGRIVL